MGYVLAPHTKADEHYIDDFVAPSKSNPKTKLLISQHNLPVNNGYIVPDKVVITSADFWHKPTSKQVGDRIEYTSKEVSFDNLASLQKNAVDAKISVLKASLGKEREDYEVSEAYKNHLLANTKADSCTTAQVNFDKASGRQVELRHIAGEVDSCIEGRVNAEALHRALSDLNNSIKSLGFPVPEMTRLINDAAKKEVINILAGDSSRKTDTTINGFFKFNEVPKGDYLLYSDYEDNFVNGFWLRPITVKEDDQFDLNNNTLKEQKFDFYLESSIAKVSRVIFGK